MSTPLIVDAVLDGSTLVDLATAQSDPANRTFVFEAPAAGLLPLWTFGRIGARDIFMQAIAVTGVGIASFRVFLRFPSGFELDVPRRFNLIIPQGVVLGVEALDFVGQPVQASVQIWLYGINDKTYPLLGCCHAFAPEPPGAGAVAVQDEGITIETALAILNFTGTGVVATQTVAGEVQVDIPGGAAPPLQSVLFLDNVTTDIIVGTSVSGCIVVDASISKQDGEASCYRFMFGVSASGTDFDCLEAPSDAPITDIDPLAVFAAGNIILRLVGSGAGVSSGIAYRVSSIPRLLP